MTTPSVKNKSQHGSDGLEDNKIEKIEIVDSPEYQKSTSEDYEKSIRLESSQPDVDPVTVSGRSELVGEDRKLAIKMTKHISDYLGLSGRSRSVKV